MKSKPPMIATIILSFEVYGFSHCVPALLRTNLKTRANTAPWINRPAMLGHPLVVAIVAPSEFATELVRVYVMGDARIKNIRPAMIEEVHLSEEV